MSSSFFSLVEEEFLGADGVLLLLLGEHVILCANLVLL